MSHWCIPSKKTVGQWISLQQKQEPEDTLREAFWLNWLDQPQKFWVTHQWHVHHGRSWEVEHTSLSTKPSKTNQASCQNSQRFSGTSKNKLLKEASIGLASKHVGFFNKGNTCYANSILQALSVLPSFCSQESSEHDKVLPLSRAVNLNMSLLKHKTSPIDLFNFLWVLRNKITKDRGSPFNFNGQQDVPEILQIVTDKLKCVSQVADNIISSTLQTLAIATLAFVVTSRKKNLI